MRRPFGIDPLAAQPRHFAVAFAGVLFLALALAAAAMAGLAGLERLPAPPLTATNCIDEKFRFLSRAELDAVDLLAVGSSVTWRNLKMDEFAAVRPERVPINAAPCYLYVNQTAYLTDFLLTHMPAVETVLTVLAPRDFEDCGDQDTRFFDPAAAAPYLFAGRTPWHLYLRNFRPVAFAKDVLRLHGMRRDPEHPRSLVMDAYGSGPLRVRTGWQPRPAIDPRCFAHLARLEAGVVRQGARLVVVTLPTMPDWKRRYDPDGRIVDGLRRGIAAALTDPRTVVIDGDQYAAGDEQFADAAHLLWQETGRFTRFVAAAAFAGERAAAARP